DALAVVVGLGQPARGGLGCPYRPGIAVQVASLSRVFRAVEGHGARVPSTTPTDLVPRRRECASDLARLPSPSLPPTYLTLLRYRSGPRTGMVFAAAIGPPFGGVCSKYEPSVIGLGL